MVSSGWRSKCSRKIRAVLNKAWRMSLIFYAIQVLCIRDLICCERACYAEELNECLMGRNLCGFVC